MAITDKGLKKGTVLDSGTRQYTVIRTLGAGGFGITYLVKGKVGNIDTYFAIKEHFISSKCERDYAQRVCYSKPVAQEVQDSLKDFISEAKRLNSQDVRHPNIVSINEVFEANNTAYYVMEYIPGKNLREYLCAAASGRLSEDDAITLMRPVFDALTRMHRSRITHLDIKPDNILLSEDIETGELKPVVIDFGVSKHYDAAGNATSTINVVACSPGYAPLEQYAGVKTFSPEVDVYALGATLYFLLTGENPPEAANVTPGVIEQNLPSSVSKHVRSAIAHAMAPIKHERTATVTSFREELNSGKFEENGGVSDSNGVVETVKIGTSVVGKPYDLLANTNTNLNIKKPRKIFTQRKIKYKKSDKIAVGIGLVSLLFTLLSFLFYGLSTMSRQNSEYEDTLDTAIYQENSNYY